MEIVLGWRFWGATITAAMLAAGSAASAPAPIGSTPRAFDKKIHDDYDKWGPIIRAAGIKAE